MSPLILPAAFLVAILILGWVWTARIKPSTDFSSLSAEETGVSANGFDRHGDNVELGSVTLEEAIRMLDARHAFAAEFGGTDENAEHSGVMFYRGEDDWIGFYARKSNSIDMDVSLGLKREFGHKMTRVTQAGACDWLKLYFQSSRAFAKSFAAYRDLQGRRQ